MQSVELTICQALVANDTDLLERNWHRLQLTLNETGRSTGLITILSSTRTTTS